MNKRIEISVNQEDVQNIIDCYEKDIEYIKQLEAKVNQLETNRDEAIKRNEQVIKMIEDGRSREQFLPYLKEQQEILKGSDK